MAWFNKKEEGKKKGIQNEDLPQLPPLPTLPKIDEKSQKSFSKHPPLPQYPSTSIGNSFSQNTIKEAISGERESDEYSEEEDFQEERTISPLSKIRSREIKEKEEGNFQHAFEEDSLEGMRIKQKGKEEPIFIRIDKFEESLNLFTKIKKQIREADKMLNEIKETKKEEDKELTSWENNLQSMKQQIETIDSNIFSKLE